MKFAVIAVLLPLLVGPAGAATNIDKSASEIGCPTTDLGILASEFYKSRAKASALDEKQGALISELGSDLIRKGQWSEEKEGQFFKSLVASDHYQDFEKQRSDLVVAYMMVMEGLLTAAAEKNTTQICKAAAIIRMTLDSMYSLTEAQWRYMISEKSKALKSITKK